MTTLMHNIDDVRAEIMRLENAEIFVQADWDRVQMALIEQGRTAGLADCQRRMQTALQNVEWIGGVDFATGEDAVGYFVPVAVETEPAHASA